MNKPLKVGFDLDGVILYNPIRFIRPIAKLFKPIKSFFLKQEKDFFYYPESKVEQFLFRLLHLTSFKPDPALEFIKKLVKAKKIEAYIITGRYSFLKKDYEHWLKKINAKMIFENCYQNSNDLQPNKFKEQMIKKLNLDFYIEDNWDIVSKIGSQRLRTKILWITNILDQNIKYQYKFNNLKKALQYLERI
jgi:acid phosphatase class B